MFSFYFLLFCLIPKQDVNKEKKYVFTIYYTFSSHFIHNTYIMHILNISRLAAIIQDNKSCYQQFVFSSKSSFRGGLKVVQI